MEWTVVNAYNIPLVLLYSVYGNALYTKRSTASRRCKHCTGQHTSQHSWQSILEPRDIKLSFKILYAYYITYTIPRQFYHTVDYHSNKSLHCQAKSPRLITTCDHFSMIFMDLATTLNKTSINSCLKLQTYLNSVQLCSSSYVSMPQPTITFQEAKIY